jgi:hypothetical protein
MDSSSTTSIRNLFITFPFMLLQLQQSYFTAGKRNSKPAPPASGV